MKREMSPEDRLELYRRDEADRKRVQDLAAKKEMRDQVRAIRRAQAGGPHDLKKPGPSQIATKEEVEAMRDQLRAEERPSGYQAIAKAGGWSRSTVIRRLHGT
jgi:DNA invertase Pin-like site-specific DNA recombinase